MPFIPKRVFFEKEALNYPLGQELYRHFQKIGIPVSMIGTHNRVTGIPGKTPQEAYMEAKQTLVVGVRKTLKFETCKPSAHYQLPLCTSCIGKCEYCYLNTTLGKKPYLRVYVNVEEVLDRARTYIRERAPEITYFEGAATSDPLPFEAYTGALAKTIRFFAGETLGRFRFVTKFTEVDSLLGVEHAGHSQFRFSLNSQHVIERYEHNTPGFKERVAAAVKVAKAGYLLGFIIAPVILYEGWQKDYRELIDELAKELPQSAAENLSFEIITHRFTARAKNNILSIFPKTTLPMKEEERRFKFGQFGYGKYVYSQDEFSEVKEFFTENLFLRFPRCKIDYIV